MNAMRIKLIDIGTNQCFAQAQTPFPMGDRWLWMQDAIAERYRCAADDVYQIELDDCDCLAVGKTTLARIERVYGWRAM